MPCHTIVHRQDWFLEESYRARTDREELGFLERSFELHFNERPFLNHFSYLFITRTTKERMRQQSNFSVLCRGHILPREVRDKDSVLRFLEAVEQFERIICDSGLVRLERLTTEEITGKGKEAIINNSDCKILLDQRKYLNKFERIQTLLGLTDKECSQILSINRANDPSRRYKEV